MSTTQPAPTTGRFTAQDTMVLERRYAASVSDVFAAWANRSAKLVWFAGSGPDDAPAYALDFRVGGHETFRGGAPGSGEVYTYDAEYQDIVPDARIVYSYYMLRNDTRISVSLTCVEFEHDGDGTRLVLTEHGIYLDGHDKPEYRTQGIGEQLDALVRLLEQ